LDVRQSRELFEVDLFAANDRSLHGLSLNGHSRRLFDQCLLARAWRRGKVRGEAFAEIAEPPRRGGARVNPAKHFRAVRDLAASCERPGGDGLAFEHLFQPSQSGLA
jgi:hypothetical protein